LKRVLVAILVAAPAFACTCVPAQADAPSPAEVRALAASVVLTPGPTVTDETPLADLADAARCHPDSRTRRASTPYYDELGNLAYTFHHNVTWYYNCTKVTDIDHNAWIDSASPIYQFGGWIEYATSGKNTPTGYAIAQARVGICTKTVVDGCFLESDPVLNWVVTATGGAKHYGSGS